jgi:hypothetical protein
MLPQHSHQAPSMVTAHHTSTVACSAVAQRPSQTALMVLTVRACKALNRLKRPTPRDSNACCCTCMLDSMHTRQAAPPCRPFASHLRVPYRLPCHGLVAEVNTTRCIAQGWDTSATRCQKPESSRIGLLGCSSLSMMQHAGQCMHIASNALMNT